MGSRHCLQTRNTTSSRWLYHSCVRSTQCKTGLTRRIRSFNDTRRAANNCFYSVAHSNRVLAARETTSKADSDVLVFNVVNQHPSQIVTWPCCPVQCRPILAIFPAPFFPRRRRRTCRLRQHTTVVLRAQLPGFCSSLQRISAVNGSCVMCKV